MTAVAADDGDLVVSGPFSQIALRRVSPCVITALRQIEPAGAEDQHLEDLVRDSGDRNLSRWFYYLDCLTRRGLMCRSAHDNRVRLATLKAVSPSFVAGAGRVVASRRYVLSRFAFLRRDDGEAVLESPLSHARIVLNDSRAAALIAALAEPATVTDLNSKRTNLNPESIGSLLELLLQARMIGAADADGTCSEDADQAVMTWSFHDLLFHSRSRRGRFDAPYGGTYRFAGHLPPAPALKPPMGTQSEQLYRPDIQQLERDDPPFARVQEQRRSIRTFDRQRPITVRQLGEFLYRVARVKESFQASAPTGHDDIPIEFATRPYPSGGGLYEIEFYVAIQQCEGLRPGLYHYAPDRHLLERLEGPAESVEQLLQDAAVSTSIPADELQVLIILAARFPRLAWKYESIAYALVLKHVGVIYQTMYLAATAMGIGSCAIGGGDSDLFARAAGLSYCEETSVGEFLLGSTRSEMADRDRSELEGEL